jgi:hypothetical protein
MDVTKCKGTIHKWRTVVTDPYRAPEMQLARIEGYLNGVTISTSPPVMSDGRYILTESGSVYRLGTVYPKYRKWLKDHGIAYDKSHPFKIRGLISQPVAPDLADPEDMLPF